MAHRPLKLALVGATGAAGGAILEALEGGDLPLEPVRLFASARSAGTEVEFRGDDAKVEALAEGAFRGMDLAVFAVPPDVAREWAPRAWAQGCAAIDLSAAFRADPEVPLVVPEVNGDALAGFRAKGIVAAPGAPATALALVLAPLGASAGLERISAVVLEPASGAGRAGVEQLEREASDLMNVREPEPATAIPHRLAFNVVPQVGAFGATGASESETGLAAELRRVLRIPELAVSATAFRVPVFHGTTVAATVVTRGELAPDAAREALRKAPGVKVLDAPAEGVYPMPMLAVIDESVFVGRVRGAGPRALDLVVAADNLRRAARNVVEIAAQLAAGPLFMS